MIPTLNVLEENLLHNYFVKLVFDPKKINIDYVNKILKYQDIKNLFLISKKEVEDKLNIVNLLEDYNLLIKKIKEESNNPKLKNKTFDHRKIDPKIKKAELKKKKDPNEVNINFEDPELELNEIENIYILTDSLDNDSEIKIFFKNKNEINLIINLKFYVPKNENSLDEINEKIEKNKDSEYFDLVYDKNFDNNLKNRLDEFLNKNKKIIVHPTKTFIDVDEFKKNDEFNVYDSIKSCNNNIIECDIEINYDNDPNNYAKELILSIYEKVNIYYNKLIEYKKNISNLKLIKFNRKKKLIKVNSMIRYTNQMLNEKIDNSFNLINKKEYESVLNNSFIVTYNWVLYGLLKEIKKQEQRELSEKNKKNKIEKFNKNDNNVLENDNYLEEEEKLINKLNLLTDKIIKNPILIFKEECNKIFVNQKNKNSNNNFINELNLTEQQHFFNKNFDKISKKLISQTKNLIKPIPEKKWIKVRNNIFYGLLDNDMRNYFTSFKTLKKFMELINNSQKFKSFDFSKNKLIEYIDNSTVNELLNEFLIKDNENIIEYNDIENCFYLINYYICPPGRILYKKWISENKILPNFQNCIKNNINLNKDIKYFVLQNNKDIVRIKEERKVIYPNNNSIIDLKRIYLGKKIINRISVTKNKYQFGINKNGFWIKPNENIRISLNYSKEKLFQSINYKNILLIQNTEEGDIYQKFISRQKSEELKIDLKVINLDYINEEAGRLYCGNGNIIKFYKNKNFEIMYSNGIIDFYKKDIDITKRIYYDGRVENVNTNSKIKDKIKCEFIIDYETNSKIYILNNYNKFIIYNDNSTLFIHKDGTKIFTNKEKNEFLIESKNYASVKIVYDKFRMRNQTIIGKGNSYANLGKNNLFERTSNGRIVECFIDKDNLFKLYKEKREMKFQTYEDVYINYFEYDNDFVLKSESNGESVLLSKKDNINDWFINLFLDKNERGNGVYTLNSRKKNIFSIDNQNNLFNINYKGEDKNYISISLNFDTKTQELYKYKFPKYSDDINNFIPEDCKFLPSPEKWIEPNLMKIFHDGKTEIYRKEDTLNYYKNNNNFKIIKPNDYYKENNKNDEIITILKEIKNYNKYKKIRIINKEIPSYIKNLKISKQQNEIPIKKNYIYRNFKLLDLDYDKFSEKINFINEKFNKFVEENKKLDNNLKIEERDESEIEIENLLKRELQNEIISEKLFINLKE